jgi:hypothetical protein
MLSEWAQGDFPPTDRVAPSQQVRDQGFAYVGGTTDIDILVTDSATNAKYLDPLREAGIEIILADVGDQSDCSNGSEPAKFHAHSGAAKP